MKRGKMKAMTDALWPKDSQSPPPPVPPAAVEAEARGQAEKRRLKKQQSRRRRRQREEAQEQAWRSIAAVFADFYEGRSKFAARAGEVGGLVERAFTGEFLELLDQLTIRRATVVQGEIAEWAARAVREEGFEAGSRAFYAHVLDYLYLRFQELQAGSAEVQQVFNLFFAESQRRNGGKLTVYKQLGDMTFDYMAVHDPTLMTLVRACDTALYSLEDQAVRTKLDTIVFAIQSFFEGDGEDYDFDDEGDSKGEQATAHSEEEEEERRGRAKQESVFTAEEEAFLKRLEGLNIRPAERAECRVSEDDCLRWKAKLSQYRRQ